MIRHNSGLVRDQACPPSRRSMAVDEAGGAGDLRDPGSQGLFAHWESRRAGRRAPARDDIDARAIFGLLPWTGVVAADAPRVFRWRTAGSGLIALWGRNLIGRSCTEAWPEFDRHILVRALTGATHRLRPFVAQLRLATRDGRPIDAELIGLPIEARPGGQRQVLCGMFPSAEPEWLGRAVPVKFELTGLRPIDIEPILEAAEPEPPRRSCRGATLRLIRSGS